MSIRSSCTYNINHYAVRFLPIWTYSGLKSGRLTHNRKLNSLTALEGSVRVNRALVSLTVGVKLIVAKNVSWKCTAGHVDEAQLCRVITNTALSSRLQSSQRGTILLQTFYWFKYSCLLFTLGLSARRRNAVNRRWNLLGDILLGLISHWGQCGSNVIVFYYD